MYVMNAPQRVDLDTLSVGGFSYIRGGGDGGGRGWIFPVSERNLWTGSRECAS